MLLIDNKMVWYGLFNLLIYSGNMYACKYIFKINATVMIYHMYNDTDLRITSYP